MTSNTPKLKLGLKKSQRCASLMMYMFVTVPKKNMIA